MDAVRPHFYVAPSAADRKRSSGCQHPDCGRGPDDPVHLKPTKPDIRQVA